MLAHVNMTFFMMMMMMMVTTHLKTVHCTVIKYKAKQFEN